MTDLPRTRDDELDLLACCLWGADPTDINLTAEDFYEPKHAAAWQAMTTIALSGGTISPDALRLALGDNAVAWIGDVFGRSVVGSNAPAFAERIRKAAHLRSLIAMAQGVAHAATQPDADPETIAEAYRPRLDAPTGITRPTETLADTLPRTIDLIERGQGAGKSTPWPDLDAKIHGLSPDRLYIVAARPGVGKSLLGQNLAWHWSERHQEVTYFASLEMAADELTMRTIAQASKVELDALLSGRVSEEQWDKINTATPRLNAARIHMCTDPAQSLESIRSGARQVQRRHGLGLVVVDYLQLVTPRDRRISREQQVSEISRGLKLMAKELHVPVVAMAQLRRLGENEKGRRPTMSDLRESGAIEQDADAVLLLHVPDEMQPHAAEMLVAKARAGKRGPLSLKMQTAWATISSAAWSPSGSVA